MEHSPVLLRPLLSAASATFVLAGINFRYGWFPHINRLFIHGPSCTLCSRLYLLVSTRSDFSIIMAGIPP